MTQTAWGGTAIATSSGRGVAEGSVLLVPRKVDTAKRCVFMAHGANGQGTDLVAPASPNLSAKTFALLQAGFVVLSADFAGSQTYGNDTELANYETWWAWIKTQGLCKTDKLIACGASMGTLTSMRFAREHPDQVAGIGCLIPFLDVEYGRTSNVLGLRDLINTAWGLPAGSYIGGADQTPVPTRGRPLDYASTVAAIPTHMWYSTADTVSTNVDTYAASRANVTLHVTSTSAIHGDGAVGTDNAGLVAFAQSVAA